MLSCNLSIAGFFRCAFILVSSISSSWFSCDLRDGFGLGRVRLVPSSSASLCASVTNDERPFSVACFEKNVNGLHEGVWVLIQFHSCFDFSDFVFLFNWSQATSYLVLWQVHSRGGEGVFTSTLAIDFPHLTIYRSKLSDGPVLGSNQVGLHRKSKLVRSCNTVGIRKDLTKLATFFQVTLCLELNGAFFVLQHCLTNS